jgi:hypothetical protein
MGITHLLLLRFHRFAVNCATCSTAIKRIHILFRLSGIISYVCLYGVLMAVFSGSTAPVFGNYGRYTHGHREESDLIHLLLFFSK